MRPEETTCTSIAHRSQMPRATPRFETAHPLRLDLISYLSGPATLRGHPIPSHPIPFHPSNEGSAYVLFPRSRHLAALHPTLRIRKSARHPQPTALTATAACEAEPRRGKRAWCRSVDDEMHVVVVGPRCADGAGERRCNGCDQACIPAGLRRVDWTGGDSEGCVAAVALARGSLIAAFAL